MMAMIGPAEEAHSESLSTLKFASRAKYIKNEARINVDWDEKTMIKKYEQEIAKLKDELKLKSRTVVDKQEIFQLEEERKRAELDKIAAQNVLEERSKEYVLERELKSELEAQISSMEEKLLQGRQLQDQVPAMQNAMQETEAKMRSQYASQVAELEKDRAAIGEDKAQVDHFKELLLKQRDVMISLTASLNKRDETLLAFQEELDAFDQHQRLMEDLVDQKTGEILLLQKSLLEKGLPVPKDDPEELERIIQEGIGSTVGTVVLGDAQRDELARKLEKTKEEKRSLEYLLRERLETMVQAEIEERIAKVCSDQGPRGFLELASMRSDTPEFQQRLASMVEAKKKGAGNTEASELQCLKEALQQKRQVSQDTHRRLLERIKAQDGVSMEPEGRREEPNQHGEHARTMERLQREIDAKDAAIKQALEANRKLMAPQHSMGGHHHSEELQNNLRLIEKDTQMMSRSYEEKVAALRKEKVMEERKLHAERQAQAGELQKYVQQCENDSKERHAIRTILGQKIMALVDNVASLTQAPAEAAGIHHDAQALRKLVRASVDALE